MTVPAMTGPPPGRLAAMRSSKMLQGSAWILIALGVQSVLGFLFWLIGARVATSSELGRASALFTAIQFVNYASGLGLTVALARHVTDTSDESDALFGWGVAATVVSSAIGGAAYLAAVHTDAVSLVRGSVGGWVLFCAYTAGTSVGLLVDVRLMAARRWGWMVARIAVTNAVRIPLVFVDVGIRSDLWLYHLMLAPLAVSGVLALPLMSAIDAGRIRWRRPASLAGMARFSAVNWVATLASNAPQFVLPLVVAQSVAPAINANFFLAWTVTGLVFLVPGAIAQVLLVEGSKDVNAAAVPAAGDHHAEPHRAREALGFSLGLAVLAWLGSLVASSLVTAVFGDAYARTARLLPTLMVAGIPWAITSVRLSEARIRRDQVATVAITTTLGLGILLPVLLFVPSLGTVAATRSWVFGNLAAAIVATVFHRRGEPRALLPA